QYLANWRHAIASACSNVKVPVCTGLTRSASVYRVTVPCTHGVSGPSKYAISDVSATLRPGSSATLVAFGPVPPPGGPSSGRTACDRAAFPAAWPLGGDATLSRGGSTGGSCPLGSPWRGCALSGSFTGTAPRPAGATGTFGLSVARPAAYAGAP